MKIKKSYIGLMLTAVLAVSGFSACQDDFDAPGINVPEATLQPNTTIAEVKQKYWNDADNYIDQIKLNDAGEHVVIAGRVISSDAAGNIFKSLVIQDATGALAMSINAYNLYTDYRIGQEIVLDLTEMYMGKYSTLQQLGYPDFSASYGWQASFMPLEFFKEHAQLNGLPEPAKIDTLVIDIPTDNSAEAQMKYQSQLVRLNNVYFVEGGEASFCTAHKVSGTNRTVKDANGNEIVVRTSGYANFWSVKLPAESGDIVGILSTYKQSNTLKWQLQLRSTDDLLNFGNPTLPKGTEDNPYDILEAIDMIAGDKAVSGWYTGYIVGSLKAGVSSVESADDIIWGTDAEVNNTLVIGQTPESNTLADCIVIRLPQNTALRQYGNLRDVPENYGRQIWLLGTPGKEFNMDALTGNTGAASEFRINGVTIPGEETPGDAIADGDGTEASPYNPTQVVAKGSDANEANKWVSGYIVGWVDGSSQTYADANNCKFTVPATTATNVLLATTPNETDYTKCCIANLPTTNGIRAAINLVDNPSNLGKVVSVCGTVKKYYAIPGVRDLTAYKFDGSGDTPTPPAGEVVTSFNQTFDDVTAFPTSTGWKAVETSGNAAWFVRKADANNPTNCAEITAYGKNKEPGADGKFVSWLVSPGLNVDGMTNKTLTFESKVGHTGNGTLEVYALSSADPATATKTKLNANIVQPSGQWSDYVSSGTVSLAQLSGTVYIGFCYTAESGSNYTTYRIENIVAGEAGTGGEDPTPPTPPVGDSNTVNFNTFNDGNKSTAYTDMTSTGGWEAKWCALAIGGGDNANSGIYSFLPDADTFALVIDGSKKRQGSLTSPTLTGGIKALSLNYGFAFGDKKASFTVNIKQGGEVKATKTETIESIVKNNVYSFSMEANVSGEFVIEILNDAYSQSSSNNADRVAIWNLKWDNM